MKKVLAVILAVLMLMSAVPLGGCGSDETVASGKCGENLAWTFEGGRLTISGTGELVKPDAWQEFYKNIKSVVILDGVTSICDEAFCDYTSLKNITLPDNIESIGYHAFYNTKYYNRNWSDLALYLDKYLIEVSRIISGEYCVKSGTKRIANVAFYRCDNLTSVAISDSVESIGNTAFLWCDSLKEISVDSANKYYSSLDGVLFDKSKGKLIRFPLGVYTGYTIPDGVESLDDYAFLDCQNLTDITIPDSMKDIGKSAFISCNGLTKITVGSANKYYSSLDGVLFDKSQTKLIQYPDAKKTRSYTVPDNVTSICDEAFDGCHHLDTVKILNPDCVIDEGAFDCEEDFKITLCGYAGSSAEAYAKEKKLNFKVIN